MYINYISNESTREGREGHLDPRHLSFLQHGTPFSIQDPYCILALGNEKHKTNTKNEAGKRPIWNETFTFNSSDNNLSVRVMDQDTLSDDVIGEGKVDLMRFRNSPGEQEGNFLLMQSMCSCTTRAKLQAECS